MGIQPDVIICRSDEEVTDDIKAKIAVYCDVIRKGVIALPTVDSIYLVPLMLEEEGLGDLIVEGLGLQTTSRDLVEWREMVDVMSGLDESLPIALVGKYVDLQDSYISVKEALHHAGLTHGRNIDLRWISAEEIEENGPDAYLDSVSGIVIPGGFGPRGVEGMIETVKYARNMRVPYLGLCLGLQVMVVEVARNVLGMETANSTEFDKETADPVIDLMPEQKDVTEMGGTMRLGVYPCELVGGSNAAAAYGSALVNERHRHRFEVNNAYLGEFEAAGLHSTGRSPDGRLVEIMELVDLPFMVGVQFHPEFLSRPDRPHPLFREFIAVAKDTLREGGQHVLPLGQTGSP